METPLSGTIFFNQATHSCLGAGFVLVAKEVVLVLVAEDGEMVQIVISGMMVAVGYGSLLSRLRRETHSSYRVMRSSYSLTGSVLGQRRWYSSRKVLPKPPNILIIPSSYSLWA